MARTNFVKKARKPQRCELGHDIPVGAPYKYVVPRAFRGATGHKRSRCMDCPGWRPSELTSSDKRATALAACEAASDALSAWEDDSTSTLGDILNEAAEGLREAASGYRESAENIESGFGNRTSMCDDLEEKADALENAADNLESWSPSGDEDFDEDAVREECRAEILEVRTDTEAGEDEPGVEVADDDEELVADVEAKRQEWRDEVRGEAEDALSEAEGEIP